MRALQGFWTEAQGRRSSCWLLLEPLCSSVSLERCWSAAVWRVGSMAPRPPMPQSLKTTHPPQPTLPQDHQFLQFLPPERRRPVRPPQPPHSEDTPVGSALGDFTAAYGQPTLQQSLAATDDFWGDSQHTILIGVDVTKGEVTQITVVGPPLSTSSQTYSSCAAFLPSDAASYNSAPPDTDFHSSIGDLVLENDGEGLCMVYVVAS